MSTDGLASGAPSRMSRGARLLTALLAASATGCAATPTAGEGAEPTTQTTITPAGTAESATTEVADGGGTTTTIDRADEEEPVEDLRRPVPVYGGPPDRRIPPPMAPEPTPEPEPEPEGSEEPLTPQQPVEPTPPERHEPIAVPLYGMPPM